MRNQASSVKAISFMSKNPTFIGRVRGVDLYESPTHGDEAPLMALTADGRIKRTDHWELPSFEEAADLDALNCADPHFA